MEMSGERFREVASSVSLNTSYASPPKLGCWYITICNNIETFSIKVFDCFSFLFEASYLKVDNELENNNKLAVLKCIQNKCLSSV